MTPRRLKQTEHTSLYVFGSPVMPNPAHGVRFDSLDVIAIHTEPDGARYFDIITDGDKIQIRITPRGKIRIVRHFSEENRALRETRKAARKQRGRRA